MYVHCQYTLLGSQPEALEYHFHRLLLLFVHRRYKIERHQLREGLCARRARDT